MAVGMHVSVAVRMVGHAHDLADAPAEIQMRLVETTRQFINSPPCDNVTSSLGGLPTPPKTRDSMSLFSAAVMAVALPAAATAPAQPQDPASASVSDSSAGGGSASNAAEPPTPGN